MSFTDPTYVREEIEANPIWRRAFELSELRNDTAPIGWSFFIAEAEAELAPHQEPASGNPEAERDWSGPYEFHEQDGPRELKLKRRHWVLGQSGGDRRGVAIVFGDDDGPVKLLAASHELADALEAILPRLSYADWPEPLLNGAWAALRKAGRP